MKIWHFPLHRTNCSNVDCLWVGRHLCKITGVVFLHAGAGSIQCKPIGKGLGHHWIWIPLHLCVALSYNDLSVQFSICLYWINLRCFSINLCWLSSTYRSLRPPPLQNCQTITTKTSLKGGGTTPMLVRPNYIRFISYEDFLFRQNATYWNYKMRSCSIHMGSALMRPYPFDKFLKDTIIFTFLFTIQSWSGYS